MKKKRANPYKEANEAFLHEHTTFQEDLTKAVCIMEEWLEFKTSVLSYPYVKPRRNVATGAQLFGEKLQKSIEIPGEKL